MEFNLIGVCVYNENHNLKMVYSAWCVYNSRLFYFGCMLFIPDEDSDDEFIGIKDKETKEVKDEEES